MYVCCVEYLGLHVFLGDIDGVCHCVCSNIIQFKLKFVQRILDRQTDSKNLQKLTFDKLAKKQLQKADVLCMINVLCVIIICVQFGTQDINFLLLKIIFLKSTVDFYSIVDF